jgi:hypothetical protein
MHKTRNVFARLKSWFAAKAAALALPSEVERQKALDKLKPYHSRGHGGRHAVKSRHTTMQDKRRARKRKNQLRARRA